MYSAGHIVRVSDILRVVWHYIDPSIVAGFYIVRVPGIVRVNFHDTYPHYIGPPTVQGGLVVLLYLVPFIHQETFLGTRHVRFDPVVVWKSQNVAGVRCGVYVFSAIFCLVVVSVQSGYIPVHNSEHFVLLLFLVVNYYSRHATAGLERFARD